jgi:hypothetical protein
MKRLIRYAYVATCTVVFSITITLVALWGYSVLVGSYMP